MQASGINSSYVYRGGVFFTPDAFSQREKVYSDSFKSNLENDLTLYMLFPAEKGLKYQDF